jgi:hypothetical protein
MTKDIVTKNTVFKEIDSILFGLENGMWIVNLHWIYGELHPFWQQQLSASRLEIMSIMGDKAGHLIIHTFIRNWFRSVSVLLEIVNIFCQSSIRRIEGTSNALVDET